MKITVVPSEGYNEKVFTSIASGNPPDIAALGIPVLDGLGAVGEGAHARQEAISINGMIVRTALAAGLLTTFSDHGA